MMRTRQFLALVCGLGVVVLLLQIIRAILLHLVHQEQLQFQVGDHVDTLQQTTPEAATLQQLVQSLQQIPQSEASGAFSLWMDVLNTASSASYHDVSLALHASVDSLSHLPIIAERWRGAVSLAVFVSTELAADAVALLLAVRVCTPPPRLALHVVTPAGLRLPRPPLTPARRQLCALLQTPPPPRSYNLSVPYPNNLLRDVARRGVDTALVLSLDADMVPSVGFREQIRVLANSEGLWEARRTALVPPLYEVSADADPPADKQQLVRLRGSAPQLLRPFYSAACARCQAPTDFARWEAAAAVGRPSVLYRVPWRDPWEPVYVLHRSAPSYDPRFRQFGFNRISHACELHVAGFEFAVLADAFVVHIGLKDSKPARPEQQTEQDSNRLLFRQFKNELKLKYPESPRRCY